MKTEKISNSLLSFVCGVECECVDVSSDNKVYLKAKSGQSWEDSTGYLLNYNICEQNGLGDMFINLDTFIDLALYDWLDRVNYEFNLSSVGISIKKMFLPNMKGSDPIEVCMRTFSKYSDIPSNRKELIIECLEWVKNQIKEG
jgi:hypothetical protein